MLHLLQLTMGPHESALPYTSTPALEMTVFRQHCPRGSIRASTRPISSHRFRHHGSSSLGSASSSSSSSSTTTLPGPSTTSLLGPRLHGATTVPGIMPTYCSYDVACTLYPTYVCRATLYILRWLFFHPPMTQIQLIIKKSGSQVDAMGIVRQFNSFLQQVSPQGASVTLPPPINLSHHHACFTSYDRASDSITHSLVRSIVYCFLRSLVGYSYD